MVQIMLHVVFFSRMILQGRDDEANWVTTFSAYYSTDGATWTKFVDSKGDDVSRTSTSVVAPQCLKANVG